MKRSRILFEQVVRVIDKINDGMSWVVISLVMGITIIINYEVLMRYVFSSPTQFSNEISRIIRII